VVSNLLAYLLNFALAAVLWRVSRSAVVIALAFGVLGTAAYMASPRPVEMLMLARAYAEADAAGQLAMLATGEGMRATWMGTAFDIYYLFNLVTLLVFAVLMYRGDVFTRPQRCGDWWRPHSWRSRRTSVGSASYSPWPRSSHGPYSPGSWPAGCSP
jgi:hypothetical protein